MHIHGGGFTHVNTWPEAGEQMKQFFIRTASEDDVPDLHAWDEEPQGKSATSNHGSKARDVDRDDELLPRNDGAVFSIAEVDGFQSA